MINSALEPLNLTAFGDLNGSEPISPLIFFKFIFFIPWGPGLEPHRRHCVVVFEQDTFILA